MNKEDKRKSKFAMMPVIIIASIALVFCIVDIFLYKTVNTLQNERLRRAKSDYNEILRIENKIKGLESKIPPGALIDRPERPDDLVGFLENKAKQSGFSKEMIQSITPISGGARKIGPWREYSFSINFKSTPSEKIRRDNLVRFLFNIERERPFLKTKDIVINQFTPQGDIEATNIIISYFNRE